MNRDPNLTAWMDVFGDGRYGLLDTQQPLHFVEGFFSQSLPRFIANATPPLELSLLLADADAYDSTMDILYYLYPYVAVGGFIVIDDFHIPEAR